MAGQGEHGGGAERDPIPDAARDRDRDVDVDVARLQRIAYGSGATDAERAAAARALAEATSAEGQTSARGPASTEPAGQPHPRPTARTGSRAGGAETSAAHERPETRLRWAIVSGAAALAVGLLIGWGLGSRDAARPPVLADGPPADELTYAEYLDALPLVMDAEASAVFARESISGDALPPPWARDGFFQPRLLLTLSDGSRVFAARRDDEVCVVLAFPIDGGQSRCTEGGRFPEAGIRVAAAREAARFEIVWRVDGSVAVTTEPR